MKKTSISVPKDVRFLSDWAELPELIPSGKVILNKVTTGCGATTYYLDNGKPVILCSPRKQLLFSKHRQHADSFLFRDRGEEKTPLPELIENLQRYSRPNPFNNRVPKILTTYDSMKHVIRGLSEVGELDKYTIVVDEFQCIFKDSAFKAETELIFVDQLEKITNDVIYLSATPMMEEYLDMLDEFKDLPYIELEWDNTAYTYAEIDVVSCDKNLTTAKAIKKIVEDYRENGYFKEKAGIYSRTAVFYLNSVKEIAAAIKKNALDPLEVNVICSPDEKNLDRLKPLKVGIGSAPLRGEHHKAFTFVTRVAFEGTDFYHTDGSTFVFCNSYVDSLCLDLTIDLFQIMGRQRLQENPFRTEATLYLKSGSNVMTEEELKIAVNEKIKQTNELIDMYKAIPPEFQGMLLSKYRSAHEVDLFTKDYLSIVEDKDSAARLKMNELAMYSELRAYQLKKYILSDPNAVVKVLRSDGYQVTKSRREVHQMFYEMQRVSTFPEKMKIYSDYLTAKPEMNDQVESFTPIQSRFHKYYNKLGPEKLKALGYQESRIKDHLMSVDHVQLDEAVYGSFEDGETLLLPEVASRLQSVFDILGLNRVAKASDVKEWFIVSKLLSPKDKETGKRSRMFTLKFPNKKAA